MEIIGKQSPAMRVGIGSDVHRLKPGKGLRLGGLDIPCSYSCEAVSDGDVVVHALVDALLGACGLGDIGEYFSEANVAPGQDSRIFLTEVLAMPAVRNARLINIDCIVDVEVVRLREWKKAIRDNLSRLLCLDASRVNVKAKTAEGLGPVGEGRAVAAQAVVLLQMADAGSASCGDSGT